MKKVSIMEAQHNLSKCLREVESGRELEITRRKKVVARLAPPKPQEAIVFPDFKKRAQSTWAGAWQGTSSDELIDESRGER
ncbi:MAG: type II toxin-antitoxin system Phd/YefM family antitoxin [Opitutales bacterium]|nr:type II toxin-antitoxin system Phd/YefM family antitoxin [Opitutales bacterium]